MKVKRVFSGLEKKKRKEKQAGFIIILITARNIIHGD